MTAKKIRLSVERREYAFAVTAYEGKKPVGRIGVIKWNPPATPHKVYMKVARIDVDESVRARTCYVASTSCRIWRTYAYTLQIRHTTNRT